MFHVKKNLTFQHCNSKLSVRPIHMWFVKEDPNATVEVARLQAEAANLKPHIPEVLKDLGIDVGFLPIFCCMDGKMINCKLQNSWQARCPFCGATPKVDRVTEESGDTITNILNLSIILIHTNPLVY